MNYFYGTPPRHECEAIVGHGVRALANAAELDLNLTELNDLGINFMDGEREWDALGSDKSKSTNDLDDFGANTRQTLSVLRKVTGETGCRSSFEAGSTGVRVICSSHLCKLGEMATARTPKQPFEKTITQVTPVE